MFGYRLVKEEVLDDARILAQDAMYRARLEYDARHVINEYKFKYGELSDEQMEYLLNTWIPEMQRIWEPVAKHYKELADKLE